MTYLAALTIGAAALVPMGEINMAHDCFPVARLVDALTADGFVRSEKLVSTGGETYELWLAGRGAFALTMRAPGLPAMCLVSTGEAQ